MRKLFIILSAVLGATIVWARRDLVLPVVPDSLTEPNERAAYVLEHYWDAMDWRDSSLVKDDEFLERAAADYFSVMNLADSITASKAALRMLDGAAVDAIAYKKISEISRDYLFDPESPVANDESFLAVVDLLLADRRLESTALIRLADAKRQAMLNRVGHKASDFQFVDRDGNVTTLYESLKLHPQNILIFYDPDCHLCAELEEHLMESAPGDTGIIMISPFGEQDGLWASHAATMPADWKVGRPVSEDFEDVELYDLRSIPTVLVISNEGVVLDKAAGSRL